MNTRANRLWNNTGSHKNVWRGLTAYQNNIKVDNILSEELMQESNTRKSLYLCWTV